MTAIIQLARPSTSGPMTRLPRRRGRGVWHRRSCPHVEFKVVEGPAGRHSGHRAEIEEVPSAVQTPVGPTRAQRGELSSYRGKTRSVLRSAHRVEGGFDVTEARNTAPDRASPAAVAPASEERVVEGLGHQAARLGRCPCASGGRRRDESDGSGRWSDDRDEAQEGRGHGVRRQFGNDAGRSGEGPREHKSARRGVARVGGGERDSGKR